MSMDNPMAGHIGQGCIVRTTAEIAIASLPHLIFRRIADPKTGYPELSVEPLPD